MACASRSCPERNILSSRRSRSCSRVRQQPILSPQYAASRKPLESSSGWSLRVRRSRSIESKLALRLTETAHILAVFAVPWVLIQAWTPYLSRWQATYTLVGLGALSKELSRRLFSEHLLIPLAPQPCTKSHLSSGMSATRTCVHECSLLTSFLQVCGIGRRTSRVEIARRFDGPVAFSIPSIVCTCKSSCYDKDMHAESPVREKKCCALQSESTEEETRNRTRP